MRKISRLGKGEGTKTGPEPGEGASSVGGFHDVEGTPNDVLPGRPEPEPADREGSGQASADASASK